MGEAFESFNHRAGTPRLTRHRNAHGHGDDHKTVAASLRRQGLPAKEAKRWKAPTDSSHTRPVAENPLEQDFSAQAPNHKGVGHLTYL